MRLTGSPLVVQVKRADLVLDHLVRSRLRSFLVQLQAGSTVGLFASDSSLVRAFAHSGLRQSFYQTIAFSRANSSPADLKSNIQKVSRYELPVWPRGKGAYLCIRTT